MSRRILLLTGFLIVGFLTAALTTPPAAAATKIRVASKPFTESYVLSEMVAQILEDVGEAAVERRFGLGGPNLVVEALRSGNVDLDVNYTGALMHLFVKDRRSISIEELRAALLPQGLTIGDSLGFNNTYAIAVRAKTAAELHLDKVSDLHGHPELRGAFTPDFLNYDDGIYKLQEVYGVKLDSVKPMQHALAYRALANREIDLTDAYTTDGTLAQFDLKLLADDRDFFPKYYGVVLARAELVQRYPRSWAALQKLAGQLSAATMIQLNGMVDNKQASTEQTVRTFLLEHQLLTHVPQSTADAAPRSNINGGLWLATRQHFTLVMIALLLSCLVGIPLGIIAVRRPALGQLLVATTGLLQTIPSLALLCFLIPVLGIGGVPTVFALFIYGLLPIVQSTTSGLLALDPKLIETAQILGLSPMQRLRLIELPLASLSILSGIKTTAVINVATATIAALIGAGGYGSYIMSGLAMNDTPTILRGAIPTALMAVGFHAVFELLNRIVVPRGLR